MFALRERDIDAYVGSRIHVDLFAFSARPAIHWPDPRGSEHTLSDDSKAAARVRCPSVFGLGFSVSEFFGQLPLEIKLARCLRFENHRDPTSNTIPCGVLLNCEVAGNQPFADRRSLIALDRW